MSKLTEDFGNKTVKSADYGVCYQVHDVEALLKHARALEITLRNIIECDVFDCDAPVGQSGRLEWLIAEAKALINEEEL